MAASASLICGNRIMNSSPPSRARVSSCRRAVIQAFRHLAEQFVADLVTKGIVDRFEMV